MKHRIHYILLLCCLALCACEKDIKIDYRSAATRYVVEAEVTNTGTSVFVGQTVDMKAEQYSSDIDRAIVTITDDEGNKYDIPYEDNGYYKSDLVGVPGTTYTVSVDVDGRHFTSSSVMQKQPQLTGIRFIWRKVLSERQVFGEVRIMDTPNQENFYYIHVTRNGSSYRWIVSKDDASPNRELRQTLSFAEQGSSPEVKEGDVLSFYIRSVDRGAYDYLYSLQRMSDTGTNPITNFSGGCLGYFTAYAQTSIAYVYREAYVEEEDDYAED